MTDNSRGKRVQRDARLRWVPISAMKVSPVSQREVNQARVDWMAANLDLEQIGVPTVNLRDGVFYIIDGQHRIEALTQIGWGDQQIQCWTYEGLTEQQEAEMFLTLNDYLAVHAMDKFRVGVHAGRSAEQDIDRIVHSLGLVVSRESVPGAIGAVGTLCRVYKRGGPPVLARTLYLIREAFGDPGLVAPMIGGIGLLCLRYEERLDEQVFIQKMSALHGGVNGLLGKAEVIRQKTGTQKDHCVAAAAVEILNAGKGGRKLESWWKSD